jgi:hypothetical protein
MHSLQKGIEVPGTQLLYVNGCSDSNFMWFSSVSPGICWNNTFE